MALEFWEILIGAILLLFFLRPKTLVDSARSLGQAAGFFKKSRTNESKDRTRSVSIVDVARSLGISTEGKSPQQLSDEIVAKVGPGLNRTRG